MSLFDKHLENIFGCVAMLMGAVMAQAAFYAGSLMLGDIMFPVLALALTCLIVSVCRSASDRGAAIAIAAIMTVLLTGVFAGFAAKVRLMFFDQPAPFPFQMGWLDVSIAMIVPLCIVASAGAWRFHKPSAASEDNLTEA